MLAREEICKDTLLSRLQTSPQVEVKGIHLGWQRSLMSGVLAQFLFYLIGSYCSLHRQQHGQHSCVPPWQSGRPRLHLSAVVLGVDFWRSVKIEKALA